jgi:L-iditol 2-dehydrogenase
MFIHDRQSITLITIVVSTHSGYILNSITNIFMVIILRAAVYYRNDDIKLEEMPIPKICTNEFLLKVTMCGICGSDVMEWYRIKKAPKVLGHEVVGIITELGEDLNKYSVGDRVFVSHHVPCNACLYCRKGEYTACETLHKTNIDPGGFAEYVRVPNINLINGVLPIPTKMSDEECVFIEPLGCVLRGQNKLGIRQGDSVLVLGSGVSGILHIQLAQNLGAALVLATDINKDRMKYAKKFGADDVIYAGADVPRLVRERNDGRAIDRVIVSTSALPAINQALDCVDDSGKILYFAPTPPGIEIPIDLNNLWSRQISITTSYAASPIDLANALALIESKSINVKEMVTHKLCLAETGFGFYLVSQGGESLKVIIEPHR